MSVLPNEIFYGDRVRPSLFKIGGGATLCLATDRYAGTVIGMSKSGRTIYWQFDKVVRVDNNGMSESQEYDYKCDPDAPVREYTLRKNGRYIEKGGSLTSSFLVPGRHEYRDFSY